MVVSNKLWIELIGFTIEESVEPIEPASKWPLVERTCRRALFHWRKVPLTNTECSIPSIAENLSNSCRMIADVSQLIRKARNEVRH